MVHSMTAFSRFSHQTDFGLLTIEIQSVNRKHLEIQVSLPRELLDLDPKVRKTIQSRLVRGKINVMIGVVFNESNSPIKFVPNFNLAQEIKESWGQISDKLDLQERERGLIMLLTKETHLLQAKIADNFAQQIEEQLLKSLKKALEQLCEMRENEGRHLFQELLTRSGRLKEILSAIDQKSLESAKKHKEKLLNRMRELTDLAIEEDERIIKEVAILVDKSDITEELTRIDSHLNQFSNVLKKETKGNGKTLDFISQELNREWHTIGAKCSDLEIAHLVIDAKSECEKIREQIQNIE